MSKKNILVLGNDSFNAARLDQLARESDYNFHWLLDYDYIHSFQQNSMSAIMENARSQIRQFTGTIDGLINLWDFPGCLMAPILCKELNLISPSPASVFQCENKYLSRIQQQNVIPDCVPKFYGFDPAQSDIIENKTLPYPFWIKPVIGFSGHLGFHVRSEQDFVQALERIHDRQDLFTKPYRYLEQHIELSPDMQHAGEKTFIAEQIIGGKQFTLEGFMVEGDVEFHGIIDSYRHPNRMSFSRYEYPSILSGKMKSRICEKANTIMRQAGFDNGTFNIEFFYDRRKDKLWLLEINTRISQSHCELFRRVDGQLSHQIVVDIALGRRPQMPKRQGKFKVAGKLFLRAFNDGRVTHVPDRDKIERLEEEFDAIIYPTKSGH